MSPATAYAYYDRVEVGVAPEEPSVTVDAGSSADVGVEFSPAADDQTESCGMPDCPQGCSPSCPDVNGQCVCLGADYRTCYPTASVSSSDGSVATAAYHDGVVTIYGRAEGQADITVRASLRQFVDGEAEIHVKVEGASDASDAEAFDPDAVADTSDEASALDDRQDVVDKTVEGRSVRQVRIIDFLDPFAYLDEAAGLDNEIVFWSGDTYFHPDYSVTLFGNGYSVSDIAGLTDYDPSLAVRADADGTLARLLEDAGTFVVVDFAQRGDLLGTSTVYVDVHDEFGDDAALELFSYDDQAESLVPEDQDVAVADGYVSFATDEGKTYVVSARDRSAGAASNAGSGAGSDSDYGSSSDSNLDSDLDAAAADGTAGEEMQQGAAAGNQTGETEQDSHISSLALALIIIAIVLVVIACAIAIWLYSRRKDARKATPGSPKGVVDGVGNAAMHDGEVLRGRPEEAGDVAEDAARWRNLIPLVRQFLRFAVVGIIAFCIDYGLLVLLTEVFYVHYLISATVSFTVSLVFNYFASMRYVFTRRPDLSRHREFIIFVVLSVIGLALNDALMYVGTDIIGITYFITKIVATAMVTGWNFFSRRTFLDVGGTASRKADAAREGDLAAAAANEAEQAADASNADDAERERDQDESRSEGQDASRPGKLRNR